MTCLRTVMILVSWCCRDTWWWR